MSEKIVERKELKDECRGGSRTAPQTKKPFTEPRLTFIEPKLTKHGDVTKVTAENGFFGGFSP